METTKCLKTLDLNKILRLNNSDSTKKIEVTKVSSNPKFNLLAVSVGKTVLIFYVGNLLTGNDSIAAKKSQEMFFVKDILNKKTKEEQPSKEKNDEAKEKDSEQKDGDNEKVVEHKSRKLVEWSITGSVSVSRDGLMDAFSASDEQDRHFKETFIKLQVLDPHTENITDLCWHPKGFYLITVDDSKSRRRYGQVLIHHIAKKDTQRLFGASHPVTKVNVQRICFYPSKPFYS